MTDLTEGRVTIHGTGGGYVPTSVEIQPAIHGRSISVLSLPSRSKAVLTIPEARALAYELLAMASAAGK